MAPAAEQGTAPWRWATTDPRPRNWLFGGPPSTPPRGQCLLRVVHAWVWPVFTKNLGPVKGVAGSGLRHSAEAILAEGVELARGCRQRSPRAERLRRRLHRGGMAGAPAATDGGGPPTPVPRRRRRHGSRAPGPGAARARPRGRTAAGRGQPRHRRRTGPAGGLGLPGPGRLLPLPVDGHPPSAPPRQHPSWRESMGRPAARPPWPAAVRLADSAPHLASAGPRRPVPRRRHTTTTAATRRSTARNCWTTRWTRPGKLAPGLDVSGILREGRAAARSCSQRRRRGRPGARDPQPRGGPGNTVSAVLHKARCNVLITR